MRTLCLLEFGSFRVAGGMLCILGMVGWRSRILVHMMKKKQEDNESVVTGFSGQRIATNVSKPKVTVPSIEGGPLPWGVRGLQRFPGTLDQGSKDLGSPGSIQPLGDLSSQVTKALSLRWTHYGMPHLGTFLPVLPPLQNCCPGILFDFQVGLQTELPAAPWRGPPVPTTRGQGKQGTKCLGGCLAGWALTLYTELCPSLTGLHPLTK